MNDTDSAERLPEPPEEHHDGPAAPPAEDDPVPALSSDLPGGTAAAIARGVMPPAEAGEPVEPDPHVAPEAGPSGAEPREADQPRS